MASYPNVTAANQYARSVVSGKILACKYVQKACQKHLDDLKRQKNKGFKYRFDKDKAERVCKFIQLLVHTKGRWRSSSIEASRIQLEPWQIFIYCVVFGWLKKKNGKRRYSEVYIEVPRKNGKSILAAGTGLYMACADGEHGAEVYCGAATEKQAWKVFEPAKLIVERLANLRKRFKIKPWAKKLVLPDGSKFEPVIGDPGDGDNPHCGIVDEFHEHKTSALYDTFLTGMGAREQPLMWVITTAGFDISSPCYEMRERSIEMLNDITASDEGLFAIIYTIDDEDDWKDEKALFKANPNLGVSVDLDFVKGHQKVAIARANKTNAFLTKHLNKWVTAKEAYFNFDKWKSCEDPELSIEQFEGESCFLGFDLAQKLDLNAMVRIFVREIDGKKHYYSVAPKFFVPYDSIFEAESKRVGDRYQKFHTQGSLIATEGCEVDYRFILDEAVEAATLNPVVSSPIDPHGATNLSHQLDDEGLEPISIQQNYTNMSDPMKELEAAILSGRFHHDGNPVLSWCISNVVGKHMPGSDDVVRPIKQKAENKIDGAVALIMAIGQAMIQEVEDAPMIGIL